MLPILIPCEHKRGFRLEGICGDLGVLFEAVNKRHERKNTRLPKICNAFFKFPEFLTSRYVSPKNCGSDRTRLLLPPLPPPSVVSETGVEVAVLLVVTIIFVVTVVVGGVLKGVVLVVYKGSVS